MAVPGTPDNYACGDCTAVPDLTRPGQVCGMTAQHAVQQGRQVAGNVAGSLGKGAAGFTVAEAATGAEATQAVRTVPPAKHEPQTRLVPRRWTRAGAFHPRRQQVTNRARSTARDQMPSPQPGSSVPGGEPSWICTQVPHKSQRRPACGKQARPELRPAAYRESTGRATIAVATV